MNQKTVAGNGMKCFHYSGYKERESRVSPETSSNAIGKPSLFYLRNLEEKKRKANCTDFIEMCNYACVRGSIRSLTLYLSYVDILSGIAFL